MKPKTVSVRITDSVKILYVCVNTKSNQLVIFIDRPWYQLSERLQKKLFKVANSLGTGKFADQLHKGWTPAFMDNEN